MPCAARRARALAGDGARLDHPDAITGDIYLVKVPGKTLPGLGLSFTGRYAQRVLSTVEVNKDGRLVTNFASIPDLHYGS